MLGRNRAKEDMAEPSGAVQRGSEEAVYPAIDRALALLRNRLQVPSRTLDISPDPVQARIDDSPVHEAASSIDIVNVESTVEGGSAVSEAQKLLCSALSARCREAALTEYSRTWRLAQTGTTKAANTLPEQAIVLLRGFYHLYLIKMHFASWKRLRALRARRILELDERVAMMQIAPGRLLAVSVHVTDFIASRGKLELAVLWDKQRVKRKFLAHWLRAVASRYCKT
jgi:hypothetical protein